jgi:triosephosphate isomerase
VDYPLVVGNWKMNLKLSEALILGGQIIRNVEYIKHIDVVLCPPAVFIYPIYDNARTRPRNLYFGLQNMMWEDSGEYTGEISGIMVKGVCKFVILGHSERRRRFGETDEMVQKKVAAALKFGLNPIICVGEAERFHLEDYYEKEVERMKKQGGILLELDKALEKVNKADLSSISIAYEPIWAIGTGNAATGAYAAAIAYILKSHLKAKFGEPADEIKILYGGSVDKNNVREFMMQPNLDGLLVGGASLQMKEFCEICKITSEVKSGR